MRDVESLLVFSESVTEPRILEGAETEISSSDGIYDSSGFVLDNDDTTQETNTNTIHKMTVSDCNPGWADAMAKILKTSKPKHKKAIVLAKAKKLQDVSKKGKIVSLSEIEQTEKRSQETKVKRMVDTGKEGKRLKKKEWENKGRVRPQVLDKNREKALAKIATKGVVQLFNAVRQHQKKLDEQFKTVKNSEFKKDKIIKSIDKRAFLDVLMGKSKTERNSSIRELDTKEEDEGSLNKTWKVLHEDFMTGARLKDWDRSEVTVEEMHE